jgi:NADPH:quinone reductase-like Zn-dependent oxidoreductase
MRAYRFDRLDDLRVREEANPRPQRGEVLVQVHAVSLNFRDIAMVRGRYPRKCIPGLIPASDAAGEVVEIGAGVAPFKVGDRVMGAFFQLQGSGASFRNITVGDRAGLLERTRVVAATGLKPIIDRVFAVDQAKEAFAHLESGAHLGKVVIRCVN